MKAVHEDKCRPMSLMSRITRLAPIFAIACAVLVAGSARANEVKIDQQGLEAVGNLDLAPGKSLKTDGVVLLLHGTLTHHRMEIISALQELLHERGMNSLAITLSLGLNSRQGLYDCSMEQDHRNEDAVEEIRAWVEWLKSQGTTNITLAGHARGGNQVAIYAAKNADKAVKKLVLIAPLAQTPGNAGAEYEQRFRRPLQPTLEQAEKSVAEHESSQFMGDIPFLTCEHAKVTAGAFVNYYGNNQNLYTPSLLPFIKMPVLVAIGDQDPLYNELSPAIEGIPDAKLITFAVVPGADHFFHDAAADELANRIRDFVHKK